MEDASKKIAVIDELSIQIYDEDHTMLNPLRWVISNNWVGDAVEFCGYTIPHPSERISHLNVQLEDRNAQSPKNVLKKVYEGLECIEVIAAKLLESIKEVEGSI
ncbi:uncharacterized protein VICG_00181 [Vittaforma corneae ATCC 50505]|uniref:DNA-directed RNA polymerase RBP11-like dimerisation domain-containing protein n=1 Tax=Vittaforma corneae (strain ATCC 50505) TaxID=993615 RepID=L2GPU8_VITCO|nr:uncharacterized protein VICG_00181 [Vittaforma corneae ATCC 50505]ELA42866.1 hypothetical protein VICG_00181 [Vittaforma corneae ATCC 50505]